MEEFRKKFEHMKTPEVETGCLVKLRDDLTDDSLEAFADSHFFVGIAYRVLLVDRDEDGDLQAWIGPNIYEPSEIEQFHPEVLKAPDISRYDDVLNVPLENLRRMID